MYYSIYPRKKKALLQKKSGVFDFFYEIYVKFAFAYPIFDISKLYKSKKNAVLKSVTFSEQHIIKAMKIPTAIKLPSKNSA